VDHGEGSSSRFKKKKKNHDKRRRDDNLVVVVERKASRPKGNLSRPVLSKDHFEKLLDAMCPHHEVPIKYAFKDCQLIKNYVNDTLKPRRWIHPRRRRRLPTTTMTTQGLSTQVKMARSTRSSVGH
jgi:hypothetical protein